MSTTPITENTGLENKQGQNGLLLLINVTNIINSNCKLPTHQKWIIYF